MPSYVTPKINTEFIFYVSLVSQADTKIFQANPTLAAGDVKVSTDGAAEANITTLPVVTPAASKRVKVTLSAAEMNGDNVQVTFSDAAGSEWCDLTVNVQTTANQIDEIYSDTTAIHSDTTIIASDAVLIYSDTAAIHSDTTIIASDVVLVYSDTAAIHSDTTIIASDVVQVYSDTTVIASDVVQIYSDTTVIASDVVLVYSDTAAIHSDTTIIASDVVQVYSDTTVIASDIVQIYSDTTIVVSDTTAIHSDTTIIASDAVIIVSDTAVIESQWTTAITEAYAADGAAFTPAQGMYMIYSALAEFAIAGTTVTCKQLDGTTTAMTFTLDDGTNPTSRTRAT